MLMLKLKAVARRIRARHQTLLPITIRDKSPRARLDRASFYESRSGTRHEYLRDRKHKYHLSSFQRVRLGKALTPSLRPENVFF